MSGRSTIVEVSGLSVQFGGLRAVSGVSFSIAKGEVVGLVGPNGAGKSTLFNAVTGLVAATSGTINLFGKDVTSRRAHQRMRLGVARTFQLGGLVPGLTVLENVALGVDQRGRLQDFRQRLPRPRRTRDAAQDVLDRLGLGDLKDVDARSLGSGTQRVVEVARCVASGAELFLLDEPGVGLTLEERDRLRVLITGLAADGTSVFLTDHDADIVFGVSDRVLVLDHGTVIALGPADEVRQDPAVALAYLGANPTEESL